MKAIIALIGTLVIAAAIFLGLTLYTAFAYGYVVKQFYDWFVFSQFTGLPIITFAQAIGIATVLSLFKNHHTVPKYKLNGIEIKDHSGANFMVFLMPWAILLMGYIVKWIFF